MAEGVFFCRNAFFFTFKSLTNKGNSSIIDVWQTVPGQLSSL